MVWNRSRAADMVLCEACIVMMGERVANKTNIIASMICTVGKSACTLLRKLLQRKKEMPKIQSDRDEP